MVLGGLGEQQPWGKRSLERGPAGAAQELARSPAHARGSIIRTHRTRQAGQGLQRSESAQSPISHRNRCRRGTRDLPCLSWSRHRGRRAGLGGGVVVEPAGTAPAPAPAGGALARRWLRPCCLNRVPFLRLWFPFLCTQMQKQKEAKRGGSLRGSFAGNLSVPVSSPKLRAARLGFHPPPPPCWSGRSRLGAHKLF